jgi:hypothetical protein
VADQTDGAWVAHCSRPYPLLAAEEAEALLGRAGLRHLWFDCTQSLVVPAGESPGWYIVPQTEDWWPKQLLESGTESGLQLVYRHDTSALLPSFDVYYWPGGPLQPDPARLRTTVQGAEGAAVLTGYQVDSGVWTTFWRVESAAERPLSIMAHLYLDGQPAPLVGDNLGYPAGQWQPGDTFWQRFPFPPAEGARTLETGLYDYQTLEASGDVLRLPGP